MTIGASFLVNSYSLWNVATVTTDNKVNILPIQKYGASENMQKYCWLYNDVVMAAMLDPITKHSFSCLYHQLTWSLHLCTFTPLWI